MTMQYPYLWYNEECYKGTMIYLLVLYFSNEERQQVPYIHPLSYYLQSIPFITIGEDHVVSELCYKVTTLQWNSFSYNFIVKFHG